MGEIIKEISEIQKVIAHDLYTKSLVLIPVTNGPKKKHQDENNLWIPQDVGQKKKKN